MSFRFRKLYADLVAEDGTVLIAYATWTALGPFGSSRRGGIELYAPDGRRTVGCAVAPPAAVREPEGALEVRLRLPSGDFVLRHWPEHAGWRPGRPAPVDGLDWWVEIARGRGEASWPNGSAPPLTGVGYVDWVDLRRPPRRLGLRTLRWGRLHLADETVIFTRLDARGGSFQRAARWCGVGMADAWDSVDLRPDGGSLLVRLGGGRWERRLTTERTLHAGAALDGHRFPRASERVLARLLSGPIWESRSLARLPGGWGLHESVRFADRSGRRDPRPTRAELP